MKGESRRTLIAQTSPALALRATSDKLLPCQTLLKCGKELSKSASEPLPDLLKVLIRAILGKEPGPGKELMRRIMRAGG
jgi:hypothetical protein